MKVIIKIKKDIVWKKTFLMHISDIGLEFKELFQLNNKKTMNLVLKTDKKFKQTLHKRKYILMVIGIRKEAQHH